MKATAAAVPSDADFWECTTDVPPLGSPSSTLAAARARAAARVTSSPERDATSPPSPMAPSPQCATGNSGSLAPPALPSDDIDVEESVLFSAAPRKATVRQRIGGRLRTPMCPEWPNDETLFAPQFDAVSAAASSWQPDSFVSDTATAVMESAALGVAADHGLNEPRSSKDICKARRRRFAFGGVVRNSKLRRRMVTGGHVDKIPSESEEQDVPVEPSMPAKRAQRQCHVRHRFGWPSPRSAKKGGHASNQCPRLRPTIYATAGGTKAPSMRPPLSFSGCPPRRFPQVAWAWEMVARLRSELREAVEGGLGSLPLRLGTDCSGAEAPVFAFRQLQTHIEALLRVHLSLEHEFSCDVNQSSRRFISQNCQPRHMFPDLRSRGATSFCLLAQRVVPMPKDLDFYIAGFPCKDFSMLNRFRPCLSGPNASVFQGVVRYITMHEPRVFILENVPGIAARKQGREAPIHEVMRVLRAIPNYTVRGWKVNSNDYYLPQNRSRVYIVGIHTQKMSLVCPLTSWTDFLRGLRGPPLGDSLTYLLNDDEPEVVAEEQRLLFRGVRPRGVRPQQFGSRSLKWVQKHRELRAKLGLGGRRPLTGTGHRGWSGLLAARTVDVLELIAASVSRQFKPGFRIQDSRFVSEISRGPLYGSSRQGDAPCVTPLGILWVYQRWRWMIGLEKLALQGFPVDDLDLDQLCENEVAALAGNAMTVPMIGAFMLMVLALTRRRTPGDNDE